MSHDLLPPQAREQRVSRALMVAVSLILITGGIAFGLLIVGGFTTSLQPELERRAGLIGETIRADTERAVGIGIPLSDLVGVDDYFAEFLSEFDELDYVAIRDGNGRLLYASGEVPSASGEAVPGDTIVYEFPIDSGEGGSIDVGVDRFFIRNRLQDLALDVGVILIVTLVAAFEVMRALGDHIVGQRQRIGGAAGSGVGGVRLVLFLFVVGEEMSKSFLPLFIQSANNPVPGLDPAIAISLPIVAYLLTLAVFYPFAGRLVAAFGQRGLFLVGLVPAALSHLGMIFADNVIQIVGLRSLAGVGYALATIACLEYLLERMERGNRARTIGVFVAVVIGGTFAGTALGGIFADRMGYDAVFAISFLIVVAAGLLALRMMRPGAETAAERSQTFTMQDITAVLQRPSLVLLLGGVTIPMNVVLAAFLWYLIPLSMAAIGSNASTIARTLMVYYLVILLGGPLVARLADRYLNPSTLVGVGSLLSGAVLLLPALRPSVASMALAVLVVGVGHTAVRGPQVALALDIAETEFPAAGHGPVLAAMRSLERLGSLIGLLVVAVLVAAFGLGTATAAIGAAAAIAAMVYLVASPRTAARSPVA